MSAIMVQTTENVIVCSTAWSEKTKKAQLVRIVGWLWVESTGLERLESSWDTPTVLDQYDICRCLADSSVIRYFNHIAQCIYQFKQTMSKRDGAVDDPLLSLLLTGPSLNTLCHSSVIFAANVSGRELPVVWDCRETLRPSKNMRRY